MKLDDITISPIESGFTVEVSRIKPPREDGKEYDWDSQYEKKTFFAQSADDVAEVVKRELVA